MVERKSGIGGTDVALPRRIGLHEIVSGRPAGGHVKAVLAGPGGDFEHAHAAEGDRRQAERTIEAVPALKMRAEIGIAVAHRRDAVLPIIG
ncbi:MAG: hypothetical protein M5U33_13455 [Pseudorhodoplanes sp.]|nr:hypothetical protein [Pseudorhodoplanes sp.]